MKLQKPGTINGAIAAALYDKKNQVIGYVLDTPNAIAYAMATNPAAVRAVAHYQLFGDAITTRDDVKNRFSWIVKDAAIHQKNVQWL